MSMDELSFIKLLKEVKFDELTFQCIYCKAKYINCESAHEVEYYHEHCNFEECQREVIALLFSEQDHKLFEQYKKIQDRIKTYNPFLFPDLKTIISLADAGFIFAGLNLIE